jgi:hypothetical protein
MSRLMELHVLSLDIWMTSLIAKFNQKLKYQLLMFLPLVNTESRKNTGQEATGKLTNQKFTHLRQILKPKLMLGVPMLTNSKDGSSHLLQPSTDFT